MSVVKQTTFLELVAGRESDFPTLWRAAQDTSAAHAVKIEWLVEKDKYGTPLNTSDCDFNYQQIFRTPYSGDNHDRHLTSFLSSVENCFVRGLRSYIGAYSGNNVSTCGGYRELLGRQELKDTDRLRLRPLRNPILRKIEFGLLGEPLDYPTHEWIAEVSIEALA